MCHAISADLHLPRRRAHARVDVPLDLARLRAGARALAVAPRLGRRGRQVRAARGVGVGLRRAAAAPVRRRAARERVDVAVQQVAEDAGRLGERVRDGPARERVLLDGLGRRRQCDLSELKSSSGIGHVM